MMAETGAMAMAIPAAETFLRDPAAEMFLRDPVDYLEVWVFVLFSSGDPQNPRNLDKDA